MNSISTDHYIKYHVGLCFVELNTILAKIRRRRSGEPTSIERNRIVALKERIAALRQGEL